jgi:hypothetical protein
LNDHQDCEAQPENATDPIRSTHPKSSLGIYQAAEKRPSASFPSSFVIAAYLKVRLIPQDFGSLASGHF